MEETPLENNLEVFKQMAILEDIIFQLRNDTAEN